MGLFGKEPKKDPKEQVKEWCRGLRKEERKLDRQVREIQRKEEGIVREMKKYKKTGDMDILKTYAKQIVHARKAVVRIYTSKAQITSVENEMKNQLAILRIEGSLKASAAVMASMQQLVKMDEVREVMQELSKEMMKAGIIEEMIEDTLTIGEDDLEDEADEEVEKVLFELTRGDLVKMPSVVHDEPPAPERELEDEATGGGEDMEDMQKRLESLRS